MPRRSSSKTALRAAELRGVLVPVDARERAARPFDAALGAEVCARLAGGELLIDVLAALGIGAESFWVWIEVNPDFRKIFDSARQMQAHHAMEYGVKLANECPNPAQVSVYRLRVEAMKYLAAMLLPGTYGNRQVIESKAQVDINGPEIDISEMSPEERSILRTGLLRVVGN